MPRKTLFVGLVGNLLEWYDFGLYGYLAPVIAQLFFPARDPRTSLASAFGVFAVGFLMRPVGAIVFGHLGDRQGRRNALAISMLMMAVSTGLMGVLPTYMNLGAVAALLLVLLRLLQGISIGGEYTGSITFILEHSPPVNRGFIGSWAVCSTVLGILLGSGVAALLSKLVTPEALREWAWRLPFMLGASMGVVGLYLRLRTDESPGFVALRKKGELAKLPLLEALRYSPRAILDVVGIAWLQASAFYLLFVYSTTYLSTVRKFSLSSALTINTASMGLLCILIPMMGKLSDRFGRRPQQIVGAAAYLVLSYPLFRVLSHGGLLSCLLAHSLFAVVHSAVCSPLPSMLVEMFPTRVRYSAISLPFNLALAIFGGCAPLIANGLIRLTGDPASPGLFLMVSAAATLGVLLTVKETHLPNLSHPHSPLIT